MTSNEEMALQDRIRLVITEMEGREHGKQTRLAEIAQCGRPVVNHWLSGVQKEISYEHAKRISDRLGYRLEWLMDGKGPKRPGDREPEPVQQDAEALYMKLSIDELKLITHFRAATPEGRSFILMAAANVQKDIGEPRH